VAERQQDGRPQDGRLQDKVVVVAGGATGIGATTAGRMAREGARVVVGDLNAAGAEETVAAINAAGGDAISVAFDISDEAAVGELFAAAVARYGGVDHLFNVAADLSADCLGRDTDIVDLGLDVWDHTMAVNLRGFVLTMRVAIPLMIERGGGAIVNTSSVAAFVGEPQRPSYAAAKAAINALTRHVASRWGRDGIRCNSVAPGLIVAHPEKLVGNEFWEGLRERNPSGRLGVSDDIASTVVFLLSDDASYVNGQVHRVDGGIMMV